jgi:hypothetical protein
MSAVIQPKLTIIYGSLTARDFNLQKALGDLSLAYLENQASQGILGIQGGFLWVEIMGKSLIQASMLEPHLYFRIFVVMGLSRLLPLNALKVYSSDCLQAEKEAFRDKDTSLTIWAESVAVALGYQESSGIPCRVVGCQMR